MEHAIRAACQIIGHPAIIVVGPYDDQPLGDWPENQVEAPYSGCMSTANPPSLALRRVIHARRGELEALLAKYKATNPRLFGSVARGDAHEGSDIDILVEMDPADGNLLMRASGLMEETRQLFGRDDIDIFPVQLLKRPISESALADAVAL